MQMGQTLAERHGHGRGGGDSGLEGCAGRAGPAPGRGEDMREAFVIGQEKADQKKINMRGQANLMRPALSGQERRKGVVTTASGLQYKVPKAARARRRARPTPW